MSGSPSPGPAIGSIVSTARSIITLMWPDVPETPPGVTLMRPDVTLVRPDGPRRSGGQRVRACPRPVAVRRVRAGAAASAGFAAVLLASIVPAGPTAAVAGIEPPGPVGAWIAEGPTRTIVDSVTPLGASPTVLLSQSADGVRRSVDGGVTWTRPAGLLPLGPGGGTWATSLAVLATDRRRAWLAVSTTGPGLQASASGADAAGPVLYATSDAGATWAAVPGDGLAGRIIFDLAAVPVASGDPVLLAADATDGILRSADGGATFALAVDGIGPDPDVGAIVVGGLAAGTEPDVAYASATRTIWRTEDAGVTWAASCETTQALPCGRPAVAPGEPSIVLAAAFTGVSRSADGGRTWTRASAGVLPGPEDGGIDSIVFSGDAQPVAWASGPSGVFRSTDGGAAWQPWDGGIAGPDVSASDRLAIDPASRARGWRIHGTAFFTTLDGGRTWVELPGPDATGVPAYAALAGLRGIHVVGTSDGIVVRAERQWVASDDAIATSLAWGTRTSPREASPSPGASGTAVDAGLASTVIYAAAYAGGVRRSADGGLTWDDWSRGLPRAPAWQVLAPPSLGDRVFVATDGGAYERAADAGSWARLGSRLPDAAVRALLVLPDGSIVAGLETRGLWRLDRGIDEWRPIGLDGRTVLSVATASRDGRTLLAATERSGLWRSPDAGRTWRRVTSTRATASVAYDPVTGTAMLATGAEVIASRDGGRTWRPATAGLAPTDPDRPWARSTTGVTARPGGGFVLTTLGGTFVAVPEGLP